MKQSAWWVVSRWHSPSRRMHSAPVPLVRNLPIVLGISLLLASCAHYPQWLVGGPSVEPILADFFGTGWSAGDCACHAVTIGSDGDVYFTVGTRVPGESARIFRFNPTDASVGLIWSADRTVTNDGSVTQGQIHAPFEEWNGEFYAVTHSSCCRNDFTNPVNGTVQKPYPGGYVLAVNPRTGAGRVVATPFHGAAVTATVDNASVPMNGEGLIASILDSRHGVLYVNTWPGAKLAAINLRSGVTTPLGSKQGPCETVPAGAPGYQRSLQAFGLDDRGALYGSTGTGEIWKYDPILDRIATMRSRMEQATKGVIPSGAAHLNMWRSVLWDERDRVFYGIHWATSWLFKYDPLMDQIEPVVPWRAQHQQNVRVNPDYAQLGLAMGPGHTIYGFVHAPAMKRGIKRSVHLVTYDTDKKIFKDHGYVLDRNGLALMFAESCAVAANGDVYTVGWVEVPPDRRDAAIRAKQRQFPSGVRTCPYDISLVRIPAAQLRGASPSIGAM